MQDDELSVSSFAVEGKTVSGYVDENGNIVLNIDSSKALNGVVGHEITHILEGTELYDELQTVLFDYAKELLSNPDNFELNIEKRQSAGSATGEKHPNTSSKLPFSEGSLTQKNSGVNKKISLTAETEAPIKHGNYNVYSKDIALETQEDIAPIQEQTTETPEEMFPDSITPTEELDSLLQRRNELESSLMELSESDNFSVEEFDRLNNDYKAIR